MNDHTLNSPPSLRLETDAAANDTLTLPEVAKCPHVLLRIVPRDISLRASEAFERDPAAFESVPYDPCDSDSIMIGPWDRWLDGHPEVLRRYAGLHVALHPTIGVYASANTFEALVERVQGARIPGVEVGDLLFTSFGPGEVSAL